jgi:hemolysin III
MSTESPQRSLLCDSHREEVASLITHAAGVFFSVIALVVMLIVAAGDALRLAAAVVFGLSLILLYLSSTLYHFFTSPKWKAWFQTLDHICIYLLIAGSYTPVALITLRGAWGWSILGIVWSLAFAGVLVKLFVKGRKDHWISTALYLAMGWLVLGALGPLVRAISPAGMGWLVAGGLFYSIGIIFFVWRRLPFNHAIWHLFVLAGSGCHVMAVIFHVL